MNERERAHIVVVVVVLVVVVFMIVDVAATVGTYSQLCLFLFSILYFRFVVSIIKPTNGKATSAFPQVLSFFHVFIEVMGPKAKANMTEGFIYNNKCKKFSQTNRPFYTQMPRGAV